MYARRMRTVASSRPEAPWPLRRVGPCRDEFDRPSPRWRRGWPGRRRRARDSHSPLPSADQHAVQRPLTPSHRLPVHDACGLVRERESERRLPQSSEPPEPAPKPQTDGTEQVAADPPAGLATTSWWRASNPLTFARLYLYGSERTAHQSRDRRGHERHPGAPKRPPLDDEQQRERSRDQVRIIVEALGEENVGVATGDSDDPADFVYLYRKLNILVRDDDVDRVLRALERLGIGAEVVGQLGQRPHPAGAVR